MVEGKMGWAVYGSSLSPSSRHLTSRSPNVIELWPELYILVKL